tara:strand:+ start:675 stop:1211 length:537 start_codon:yes stop_codon:yes gene_type:complete
MIYKINFLNKLSLFFLIFFFLNSCSGLFRDAPASKVPVNVRDRVDKNIKEGRGIKLFGKKDNGGTFQFASSNPLWRASLDILDFIPLINASYSGGIIITDWYSDPNSKKKNEAIKISIKFLSNEIRPDAIDIKIYKKNCQAFENCKIIDSESNLNNDLKVAILKKASQLDKMARAKKK